MITLETVRGRLETVLGDPSNKIWSTAALDEAIRSALHQFSQVVPQRAIGTVAVASASYELDISGLTGLAAVEQVWLPYTAANPEQPPNVRDFLHWRELGLLHLPGYKAEAGAVARVFYTKLQTLQGLDSAAETSLNEADIAWLVVGAAGLAARQYSLRLASSKEGNAAARVYEDVANRFAGTFAIALESLAAKYADQRTNSLVTAHEQLDRYDSDWR